MSRAVLDIRNLNVGLGHSKDPKEAARMAMEGIKKPTLTLLFASSHLDPYEVYNSVREVIKTGHIVGGTTGGEITNIMDTTGTVAVLTLESPMLKVGIGVGEGMRENPRQAGITACHEAYRMITSDSTLSSFIFLGYMKSKHLNLLNINPFVTLFLPDGLSGAEEEALRGGLSLMGRSCRIVGGSTGDDFKFQRTYQFANGVYTNSVVVVMMAGLKMGIGMSHPYVPTNKGAVVTKSKGRIVYELNGRPAAEVAKELLQVDELTPEIFAQNPVGVRTGDVFADYIIKSAVSANPDGSILFYAEVPENSFLTVMKADERTTKENFKEALRQAIKDAGNPQEIGAVVNFTCVLRWLLKQRLNIDDIQLVKEVVGYEVPVIGFNTYGEQGATRGGSIGHYNQTSTLLVISKEPLSY